MGQRLRGGHQRQNEMRLHWRCNIVVIASHVSDITTIVLFIIAGGLVICWTKGLRVDQASFTTFTAFLTWCHLFHLMTFCVQTIVP